MENLIARLFKLAFFIFLGVVVASFLIEFIADTSRAVAQIIRENFRHMLVVAAFVVGAVALVIGCVFVVIALVDFFFGDRDDHPDGGSTP